MTKEEILFPLHQHCPEETERVYSHENAVQAMNTYARQEAIGFNWWLTLGDWKPRATNEWCRYESGDIKIYSTEGLYNKYEEWKVQYNQQQKK